MDVRTAAKRAQLALCASISYSCTTAGQERMDEARGRTPHTRGKPSSQAKKAHTIPAHVHGLWSTGADLGIPKDNRTHTKALARGLLQALHIAGHKRPRGLVYVVGKCNRAVAT